MCSLQRSSQPSGSEWEIWSQTASGQVVALLLTHFKALGKLLHLGVPPFNLQNGDDDDRMYILETIWTLNALICVKCWLHLKH